MVKYIIKFKGSTDFYAGTMYQHQGGKFPNFCGMSDAKRYSSRKRADNAVEKIGGNGGSPEVVEVSE